MEAKNYCKRLLSKLILCEPEIYFLAANAASEFSKYMQNMYFVLFNLILVDNLKNTD